MTGCAEVANEPIGVARPRTAGKFVSTGDEKFYVRGVTYGPFRPDESGNAFDPVRARRDLADIAANNFNTVRVYSVPPRWFLDLAQSYGLRVMVGIPWEQHVTFLDLRTRVRSIVRSTPGDLVLRDWQRNPEFDRALAWPPADSPIPRAALSDREIGGSGRVGHVCQLSDHGIPRACVSGPGLLQRLPRVPGVPGSILGAAPESGGRTPVNPRRGRTRQPAQRRRRTGAGTGLATPHKFRQRLRRSLCIRLDRRMVSGRA